MQTAQSIGGSVTEFGTAAWTTAKNLNFSTQTIDQARGFYLKQSIAGKKEGGLGGFVKQGFGSVGVNLVEMARQTPDTVANARDYVGKPSSSLSPSIPTKPHGFITFVAPRILS